MVGLTLQQPDLAGTTGAAFAGAGNVDSVSPQSVQDALPCAHRDALAAAMQLNVKSLVIGMGAGVSTEALEMDGVVRPVACHVFHRVHQPTCHRCTTDWGLLRADLALKAPLL